MSWGQVDPASYEHFIETLRQGSAGALRVAAAARVLQREAHQTSTFAKAPRGRVRAWAFFFAESRSRGLGVELSFGATPLKKIKSWFFYAGKLAATDTGRV